jgi:hypothetical protein
MVHCSIDTKVFAPALYKRGSRSYRFLRHFLKLPSRTTLNNFVKLIPFDAGIDLQLFDKIKQRVQKMNCQYIYRCLYNMSYQS